MDELAHSSDTPAGKLASEHLVAAALDSDLYPDGTAFIASDAPDFLAMTAENIDERRPLAIAYPNGHEVLAIPARGAFAFLLGTLLSSLLARGRSRVPTVHSADGAEVITLPRRYRVQLRHPPAAAA